MYGRSPSLLPARWLLGILTALAALILGLVVADKLVFAPQAATDGDALITRLVRHDARRVTIAATAVTLEAADGTTQRYLVPADRDIWPALHGSGADITITRGYAETGPVGYIIQFVPFTIMTLLLIVILRRAARAQRG